MDNDFCAVINNAKRRVQDGQCDLRDVGLLLAGRWDQDFPAALLSAGMVVPDLLLALSWLVGLKDKRPADYEEQKPLAWAAARAALAKARHALDNVSPPK